MLALFKKEIGSFLGSLLGYIVITVFLALNALFVWLMSDFNVLDYGYAGLDPLFAYAPYIFLILIPAITMKSFAEEKKTGTIEALFTKPLGDLKIILAKYFAGIILVCMSLMPTIVYVYSIRQLADPVGNVDMGAIWGSYLGLIFLASSYVAVGIFASSLTDNQILSFIYAICICLFLTFAMSELAQLKLARSLDLLILNLGLTEHYTSMSRGVIDSRDVLYFIGINAFFIASTHLVLQRRKW